MAAQIRLVRADNPSPLTGTGTNTWILGSGRVAVIDPGPASGGHLAAILSALETGEEISHIFVTHAHLDHSALAPALAARTGAPVLAFGGAEAGRSVVMSRLMAGGLRSGGEGLDHAFAPDRLLPDGALVEGDGWSLRALHTPGHLGGHLCLAAGDVLFSGDHVMGWSSTIVSPPDGDMTDYMRSLAGLAEGGWHRLLPGHGEAVENPAARMAELLAHRHLREAQIMAALAQGPATPMALTRRLYDGIAPALMPAASRNVLAHLVDLLERNEITAEGAPSAEGLFRRR